MSSSPALISSLGSERNRVRLKRLLIALLLVALVGFFILPLLLKPVLERQLSEALLRSVSIARLNLNPFALSVQVEGLEVREEGAVVAGFDQLYANLESASIWRGGPVIGELRLQGPRLRIVRLERQKYNFSDLLEKFAGGPDSGGTPRFSLNNIQISGGSIEFDDRPLGNTHQVTDIAFALPFISSLPYAVDTFVEPSFSAIVDGAPLQLKGRSKPFSGSRESELVLDLDGLQLPAYLDYLPFRLPVKLHSGALAGELRLHFQQEAGQPSTFRIAGETSLVDFRLEPGDGAQKDAPLLAFKRLDLDLANVDLPARRLEISRLALVSPQLRVRANPGGRLDWQEIFAAVPAVKPAANTPPAPAFDWSVAEISVSDGVVLWHDETQATPLAARLDRMNIDLRGLAGKGAAPAALEFSARLDAGEALAIGELRAQGGSLDLARRSLVIGELHMQSLRAGLGRSATGELLWLRPPLLRTEAATQPDSPAWKLAIGRYQLDDASLRFADAGVSPALSHAIDGLSLSAENVSNQPGARSRISTRFTFNRQGKIEVKGDLGLAPFDAQLVLDARALPLLPVQPYFTEKLNLSVTRGQLSAAGKLALRSGGEGKLQGGFAGQASIAGFHAVDKLNSADFLSWKSFHLGNVDLRLNPNSLSIGEVALADFFARVIVSREGKLNLAQIVREEPGSAGTVATQPPSSARASGAPTGDSPPLPVKIGRVTLQGGSINFTDNFVKPNYSASLRKVGGRIDGLSSAQGTLATVDLRGSYDDVAPLTVSGSLNPLAATPFLDIQAEVKGVELTSLSPYSAKYAGYAIEKGKLSLFVKYRLENRQLKAENRVFLDQLTFGDAVDSPDATKLPVTLAVALLKNRRGEIDINLPVSGSLDDPQFSVGGLIVKVILNLLTKAITSPFALLGSMFGGGEELSWLAFTPGRAVLDAAALERLEKLGAALRDRPALRLEIDGHVDRERDTEGLKRLAIENRVRALKRDEQLRRGVESGSLDDIELRPGEYPALLARVYRAGKFPKPRNALGLTKDLPVEEMEKLLLTHLGVDEEDLRALAVRRVQVVRDWLLGHGIPGERIFLLPIRLEADDAAAKADTPASRVDFSLK